MPAIRFVGGRSALRVLNQGSLGVEGCRYPGICFFKYVTQQELKHGPDAAAACDESGKCAAVEEEESQRIFLGRPAGFMSSATNLNLGFTSRFFYVCVALARGRLGQAGVGRGRVGSRQECSKA